MVRSKSGLPAGTDVAAWVRNPLCPKCNGPMYDNREKKESGKYTAQRADFSCKDKDGCDKGVWLTAEDKAAMASSAPAPSGGGAPRAAAPKLSPEARKAGRDKIVSDYFGLMKITAEKMALIAKQHGVALDMANVQAATYSVYQFMKQDGFLSPPPAAAPAPEAPKPAPPPPKPAPRPVQEDFEERPPIDAEDDLPFD